MNAIRTRTRAFTAVALVGLLASLVGCSKDPSAGGTRPTTPPGWSETQPVTVTGTALPNHDSKASADAAIGMPAPKLEGKSFDGSPISVVPGSGPLMVVFVAHWCPHCNSEIPVLRQWLAAGLVPKELTVIGVSTGNDKGAAHYPPSNWIREIGFPWPTMTDSPKSEAGRAYGLTTYPYFVIVGKDGLVKLRSSGEIPIANLTSMVNGALNA